LYKNLKKAGLAVVAGVVSVQQKSQIELPGCCFERDHEKNTHAPRKRTPKRRRPKNIKTACKATKLLTRGF
jgi:hypothetical protein